MYLAQRSVKPDHSAAAPVVSIAWTEMYTLGLVQYNSFGITGYEPGITSLLDSY